MTEKLTQQQREYEAQQQLRAHTQEFIDKFRYVLENSGTKFKFWRNNTGIGKVELPILTDKNQFSDTTLSVPRWCRVVSKCSRNCELNF